MNVQTAAVVARLLDGRTTLKQAVRRFERECVLAVIDLAGADKRAAARRLGISLASLYRKLEPVVDDPGCDSKD